MQQVESNTTRIPRCHVGPPDGRVCRGVFAGPTRLERPRQRTQRDPDRLIGSTGCDSARDRIHPEHFAVLIAWLAL